ncbi:MAG: class I mannose-6-phosphate isomerase [Chloroflexota bacterium]|nr:class I mannose-6-phosphate isomerase [Chloroflexota bacterium]
MVLTEPTTLQPLLLEPVVVERPWGGTRLRETFGKGREHDGTPAPSGGPGRIGETWETGTDARIVNGPLAGRSLGEAARALGPALLGQRSRATPHGDDAPFPLLAKLIDAREVLSVQVHPDDAWAQAHLHQPYGKTEAWHIIAADPGAVIYHGPREPVDRETLRGALESGAIRDLLQPVPVRVGDSLFTPAGTIHAIGAGIVLYEIQQYSDVTFRLYDWDRRDDSGKPRQLHIDEGLATADTTPATTHTIAPQPLDDRGERRLLLACRPFALELLEPEGGLRLAGDAGTFQILTVLAGTVAIAAPGQKPVKAGTGRMVLLPAALADCELTPTPGCHVLRAYVPDLAADVVTPLRARGVPDERIAQLGGGWPDRNDLLPLLDAGPRPA